MRLNKTKNVKRGIGYGEKNLSFLQGLINFGPLIHTVLKSKKGT